MASNLRQRLIKGMAANGFGQAVTAVIQLVMVPIFFRLLGKEGYAAWGVLGTIPAQQALSDLGFGSAALSEMTQRVARGDKPGANRVFQSCWVLISILSLTILSAVAVFLLVTPWMRWVNLQGVDDWSARTIALLLLTQVLFGQQLSLVAATYKADEHYALVTTRENWIRLAQFVFGIAGLLINHSLLAFVIGYVGAFVAGVVWLSLDMRRQAPWASWGVKEASVAEIVPLIKPALTFMAFPLALSLNQQGFINLISASLGATALATWTSLRTLSRAIVQISQVFVGPAWVEIAAALGKDDKDSARSIHHSFLQGSILISLVLSAVILAVCPFFYPIYVHNEIPYRVDVMAALVLAASLTAAWQVSFTAASSVNKHTFLTIIYLVLNGLGMALAGVLAGPMGVLGAAVSLALLEGLMVPTSLWVSLKILSDGWANLGRRLVQNPLVAMRKR